MRRKNIVHLEDQEDFAPGTLLKIYLLTNSVKSKNSIHKNLTNQSQLHCTY